MTTLVPAWFAASAFVTRWRWRRIRITCVGVNAVGVIFWLESVVGLVSGCHRLLSRNRCFTSSRVVRARSSQDRNVVDVIVERRKRNPRTPFELPVTWDYESDGCVMWKKERTEARKERGRQGKQGTQSTVVRGRSY